MAPSASPEAAFQSALGTLERLLATERWEEAGAAGRDLAKAVEACQKSGVVLSANALEEARLAFAKCVSLTSNWAIRLHKEAHASANSSRAIQNYGG